MLLFQIILSTWKEGGSYSGVSKCIWTLLQKFSSLSSLISKSQPATHTWLHLLSPPLQRSHLTSLGLSVLLCKMSRLGSVWDEKRGAQRSCFAPQICLLAPKLCVSLKLLAKISYWRYFSANPGLGLVLLSTQQRAVMIFWHGEMEKHPFIPGTHPPGSHSLPPTGLIFWFSSNILIPEATVYQ